MSYWYIAYKKDIYVYFYQLFVFVKKIHRREVEIGIFQNPVYNWPIGAPLAQVEELWKSWSPLIQNSYVAPEPVL